MQPGEERISIIGKGVVGLACATILHEAGHDVEVVESTEAPRPISRLAGGMLAPYCEGETAPEYVVHHGRPSIAWWRAHVTDVKQHGTLVVAPHRDQSELSRFAKQTHAHRWVQPKEVEPSLESQFSRGLFFPEEAHLDPRRALQELEMKLRAADVAFTSKGRGRPVDTRGFAAASDVPDLRGVRGEMLLVRNANFAISRPIRLLHPRFPCYIAPRDNQVFMIGATMIETSASHPPTAQSIMELLSAAYTLHPSFAHAEILEMGVGIRPAFSDNVPRILELNGKIYVNGMYRHGFLMAPKCGHDLLAHLTEK